jgi:hypothetical protein
MSQSEKGSSPATIDSDLLAILNGPPPHEPDWSAIGVGYMLSLTPAERLDRNDQACKVVEVLEAIAMRFNVRPVMWQIIGPQPKDAPDLKKIGAAGELGS